MPRRKPSTPLSGRTTRSARRSSNWTSSSSRWARVTDRREVVDRRRTEPRVLRQVAEGVLVHQSEFLQTNAVVVQGVAGVSTHPHWDHLLWHEALGAAPRYGTAGGAASVRAQMSDPDWKAHEAEELPPEIADDVPLDLLGDI